MRQLPTIDNARLKEFNEDRPTNLFNMAMNEYNDGLVEILDDLITWAINAKIIVERSTANIPRQDTQTVAVLDADLLVRYAKLQEWEAQQALHLDDRTLRS